MEKFDPALIQHCLGETWGFHDFRHKQREAIQSCFAKKDSLVLMSTGSGKSLCYQFPAVFQRAYGGNPKAVVIVVSPLISLMEDQVSALTLIGIPACIIGGSHGNMATENDAIAGKYALVYLTPEKIAVWKDGLRKMHGSGNVFLIAIDESHCVSEWGHDFRPAYLGVADVRACLPGAPVMALTATATRVVKDEIASALRLRQPTLVQTSLNRSNLHYAVEPRNRMRVRLPQLIREYAGNGGTIIYTNTRKESEELAAQLARDLVPVFGAGSAQAAARAYHAGLAPAERAAVQRAFTCDAARVVVATVAFGMGIDKPDIRLVCHAGMPSSVEAYYQQTGRAGRDGLPARCVLFSAGDDMVKRNFMMQKDHLLSQPGGDKRRENAHDMLKKMHGYTQSQLCRRKILLGYFNENLVNPCEGCDNCDEKLASPNAGPLETDEFDGDARLFLKAVLGMGESYGASKVAAALRGKGEEWRVRRFKQDVWGKGKHRTDKWWRALGNELGADLGLLESRACQGSFGMVLGLTQKGHALLAAPPDQKLAFVPGRDLRELTASGGHRSRQSRQSLDSSQGPGGWLTKQGGLTPLQQGLFRLLEELRSRLAQETSFAPHQVAGLNTLQDMAKQLPTRPDTLARVVGMNAQRCRSFGPAFLQTIKEYCKTHKISDTDLFPEKENVRQQTATQSSSAGLPTDADLLCELTEKQQQYYTDFQNGDSVAALAARGGVKESTVKSNLAKAVEAGLPLDFARLGITQAFQDQVVEIIYTLLRTEGGRLEDMKLKPIFEKLPQDTPSDAYGDIRMIVARQVAGGMAPLPSSGKTDPVLFSQDLSSPHVDMPRYAAGCRSSGPDLDKGKPPTPEGGPLQPSKPPIRRLPSWSATSGQRQSGNPSPYTGNAGGAKHAVGIDAQTACSSATKRMRTDSPPQPPLLSPSAAPGRRGEEEQDQRRVPPPAAAAPPAGGGGGEGEALTPARVLRAVRDFPGGAALEELALVLLPGGGGGPAGGGASGSGDAATLARRRRVGDVLAGLQLEGAVFENGGKFFEL